MKLTTLVGAATLAVCMCAGEIAFSQVTTAGTSAVSDEPKVQPKPTIAERTGWPRQGEVEAAGNGTWWAVMVILGVFGAAGASSVLIRRKQGREAGDLIEVLATATVAPRTKVVLLSTRNREVLIGLGEKGPILLTEWLAETTEVAASATQFSFEAPQEPELHIEAPVEASPEPEALLAITQGAPEAHSAPAEAPARTPVPRAHSEAVMGLLELRKKAQQTPPRGQPVMKSRVRTLENDSEWSQRLVTQMRKAAGGRA